MLSVDILLTVCLGYVALLFVIAFIVDRRSRQGPMRWLHSPVIYTLSISVYCTSWTFYGAVGSAARNGLEFVTIYLGPTLVFVGWWWLLRKLVRIAKVHRTTSIADLISSRYGKSPSLAVLVTLIAVTATTPYIALQLQSVTRSYQVIAGESDGITTAFWIAAGMALFTILFGTRNLDANERHHGVVAAIAFEAIVKLLALIAVGVFAVWGVAGGLGDVFADVPAEAIRGAGDIFGPRWVTLTFLSATAVICLPRQFQVTVVENIEERHLGTASWLFPLYLLGISLFIMPIAFVGLKVLPAGSNPDLFVLTLPLSEQQNGLALFAFLGGFSSATSMVIVAAIAVSTMVSNHIVMPVALQLLSVGRNVRGDVRWLLLTSRRVSIAAILGLGFLYFRISGGSDALAAIGLIAFVGVAQFLPSLIGGIFWRSANRAGALTGLISGALLWAYTLFLPSFGGDFIISLSVITDGPWGIAALRPQALFGLTDMDPLVHAVIWSVGFNALSFVIVSSLTGANALERLQSALFVNVYRSVEEDMSNVTAQTVDTEDLFVLAQRILGQAHAARLFEEMARAQGSAHDLPQATDTVVARLERELAGSIGAASAHAMVTRITGYQMVGMTELIDIASETQQLIETSRQLSEKSAELERTAQELRNVNERLRALDSQKDDFLSQVSHELRTPMTSIRSFSELLLGDEEVSEDQQARFTSIIHDESQRLTRLLDEILDISRLEAGLLSLPLEPVEMHAAVTAAFDSIAGMTHSRKVEIDIHPALTGLMVSANADRLRQVLINVLSNAVKYNTSAKPRIEVRTVTDSKEVWVDVVDNGGGVTRADAATIFEKFARGNRPSTDQGAGLGLPISRAFMNAMNGDLTVEFVSESVSFFRLSLARAEANPAAAQ
ncbi:MAG: sodium:solute symporter [Rhodospirillaceae bacterium]|jgi:Na+/proline symporter/nitrogen-specific signal transduction histidine kinase|nr:sodium:solute symporter [Rhodospirillaceae bacterium]MBT3809929.1 sodium:solute symporter [Rhodospirillaceae bacterium]MBT3932593.1 sodium:solute symporter [Rhodospirillaceae bacterium]MBT4773408.1 sodium:solute symporter [Rhodospirillaceae bacterium]MBT5359797.1 sodium:solute symporter [Rhodospirillaceae bacterium]